MGSIALNIRSINIDLKSFQCARSMRKCTRCVIYPTVASLDPHVLTLKGPGKSLTTPVECTSRPLLNGTFLIEDWVGLQPTSLCYHAKRLISLRAIEHLIYVGSFTR